jgi:2'-5' RNA ligase
VAGDEHLRLFCALTLPGGVVDRIAAWQAVELRGGRLVPPGNLHVTLAFLGRRPAADLPLVAGALREAAVGAIGLRLRLDRYREGRSAGMLTFEDVGGGATALAEGVQEGLEGLGLYRRERRPWLPHVTVVRFREHATRPSLRPTLDSLPSIVVPSDAAVFISKLRPGGAEYESVETVVLGG